MSGGGPFPVATDEKILSIQDLKEAADKKLPSLIREFYNAGSTDQRTLRANTDALARYHLRSRVLVNVRDLSTETTCLGKTIKFPLCCAPAGIQGAAHPDGEVATSRAVAAWGVNQAVSSFASFGIDEIVNAGKDASTACRSEYGAPVYAMQMYPMRDRALQERIIKRAETAGCKAVFVTGDSPVLGVRYNEWRNDFRTPDGIGFPIFETDSKSIRQASHDNTFKKLNDDGAEWSKEIAWLRQRTKMKVFVKGVMCAEDVRAAIAYGCDGVVVSNHGGRQLDGVPGTIDVLEECVDAARGSNLEVHVDGGFRRGSDIFVALALGARCCWVGRPVLWGLAYDGQKGVERMLEIMYEDFRRCMALCGCNRVEDIHRGCLARMGLDGVLRPLGRGSRL